MDRHVQHKVCQKEKQPLKIKVKNTKNLPSLSEQLIGLVEPAH